MKPHQPSFLHLRWLCSLVASECGKAPQWTTKTTCSADSKKEIGHVLRLTLKLFPALCELLMSAWHARPKMWFFFYLQQQQQNMRRKEELKLPKAEADTRLTWFIFSVLVSIMGSRVLTNTKLHTQMYCHLAALCVIIGRDRCYHFKATLKIIQLRQTVKTTNNKKTQWVQISKVHARKKCKK